MKETNDVLESSKKLAEEGLQMSKRLRQRIKYGSYGPLNKTIIVIEVLKSIIFIQFL